MATGATLSYAAATSYTVAVQALDTYGGFSPPAMFTINVTKAPPVPPANLASGIPSVLEGAAYGTLVGITAYSSDIEQDPISYSLTNSAGGRFAIDAVNGLVTVADGSLISYADGSYSITVQASDGHGDSSSTEFTINVNLRSPVRLLSAGSRSSIRRPSERASRGKPTCRWLAW